MNYEIEELVPLVGKLTAAYTSFESSSISYEKAEQLMEAVLYCIHEAEYMNQDSTALAGQISARQAYEAGFQCVEQKTKEALKVYHRILPGFCNYENRCLYDTFVKGIPEFFKWYDTRYEPQNTILTLDYPVLKDLSALTGIDRIYEYIICIGLEQCFLGGLPENWVLSVLMQYSPSYRELPENICAIVTGRIAAHLLIQKPLSEDQWESRDYARLHEAFEQVGCERIQCQLKEQMRAFICGHYRQGSEIFGYLADSVAGTALRLELAASYGVKNEI